MHRFVASSLALLATSCAFAAPAKRPARVYDLVHVNWSVELQPKTTSIRGDVVNVVRPLRPTNKLWFDALGLNISSVTVDGIPATFSLEESKLWVTTKKPVKSLAEVRIRYSAAPQAGLYFIPKERAFPAKTDVVYSQGEMEDTRNWIPTYDFPDDKATSEGTITAPKGYRVLSNGKLISHKTSKAGERWQWKMDQPHSTYLISIVAGNYTEIVEQEKGPRVSFWVPAGLEKQGRNAFWGTAGMIREFERLTGFPYPYVKYSQSAVPDFMFGGMENITATTQTINCLFDEKNAPLSDATELVAHELAHQWFGNTITTPNWGHIWVNEGWATMMPVFYARAKDGKDAFDKARLDVLSNGFGASSSPRPVVSKDYTDPLEMFDGNAYPGGASRMLMLMRYLGEPMFWKCTKAYLQEYKYKNVTTEQLFASFSKTSGEDLDWFRRQWFYEAGAPRITVTREDGKIVAKQGAPGMELRTEILDETGRTSAVQVVGNMTVLPTTGKYVLLDPEVWQMTQIDYQLGWNADDWKKVFAMAPNVAQKLRLIQGLDRALSDTEIAALAQSEPSEIVRVALIGRSGSSGLAEKLLDDPSAEVRRAAVQTVAFRRDKSPELIAALQKRAQLETNEIVRLAVFRALTFQRKDDALVESASKTDSDGDAFRIFALEYDNPNPDAMREKCLAILKNPPSEPVRVAAIGHLGELKDRTGQKRVYAALVAVAREPSFGARSAAISALGQYGDRAAIAVLQPLTRHPLSFFRGDAERAINALSRVPVK